jgi:hypothetical protein
VDRLQQIGLALRVPSDDQVQAGSELNGDVGIVSEILKAQPFNPQAA